MIVLRGHVIDTQPFSLGPVNSSVTVELKLSSEGNDANPGCHQGKFCTEDKTSLLGPKLQGTSIENIRHQIDAFVHKYQR